MSDLLKNDDVIEAVGDLEKVMNLLGESDKAFANDLINGKWGFKKRGGLSEKQMAWVRTLLKRALTSEEVESPMVSGFESLVKFFDHASTHLKYPKITIALHGVTVRVSRCGESSKYHGQLNVTDDGHYPSNRYYGRIAKDGIWNVYAKSHEAEVIQTVTRVLKLLTANPMEVAKKYGEHSGNCMFCSSKLTDEKSTLVGYGPVCADHWNLPWGAK